MGATSDNSSIVLVLIIIAALVLLGLCGGAVYGGLLYRQGVAKENIQLVKQVPHFMSPFSARLQVDNEATDFEANLTTLQSHVQKVTHRDLSKLCCLVLQSVRTRARQGEERGSEQGDLTDLRNRYEII